MRGLRSVMAVAMMVWAIPVAAQETTGGLRGRVADEVDVPLPGVLVEASGPSGWVQARTDDEGLYRLPRVAPGSYTVVASLEGLQPVTANGAYVVLGEAVTVDFTLRRGTFEGEIQVLSAAVAIDFSESQTATSIRSREIDFLPRGRDFTDVVPFAAGAVFDNQGGGLMIDGASGLENRFVIDGINTTDPEIGVSSVPLRAELMQEVQVKSAGYVAEYGGAVGGVINAVTRSGGNELHGGVLVELENNEWNGAARPQYEWAPCSRCEESAGASLVTWDKDDVTRYDPGLFLGGPILRDRLWFFASYLPGFRTTERTVEWLSSPTQSYRQESRVDSAIANLAANLGSRLLLKVGLNLSPTTIDGSLPARDGQSGPPDPEEWAAMGTEGDRETLSLSADWVARDDLVVSARGGLYHANVVDTGIPLFDVIHNYSTSSNPFFLFIYGDDIPPEAQHGPGWFSDPFVPEVNSKNVYERWIANLDATWFVDAGGTHAVKVGYQAEETSNDVRNGYNADRILYYWDLEYTTAAGETLRGDYGVFRLLNISTLGEVAVRNDAVFLQDSWSVHPNLTLNLGLRAEHEEIPNYGPAGPDPAIEFGFGDKLAPRIGFAWDLLGDAKWKLYGSWGRYFDVTKFALPRTFFGADKWVDFWFTFDRADPFLNDAPSCRTGSNTVLERPDCPAGTLIDIVDQRFNGADPLYEQLTGFPGVDPDLKPMESWEAQLGLDHQLTPRIRVGARYVHKELVRAVEDVAVLESGFGWIFAIGNPGEGTTAAATTLSGSRYRYPKPVREYDALELSLDRRFSDRWSLRAYYTLSRLWGNYPGLVASDEQTSFADPLDPSAAVRMDPNVSALYDQPVGLVDANGEPVYGRLATDRTHQLRTQLLYTFDVGLSVGVTQFVASGAPRSELAFLDDYYLVFPRGRGGLGETPWLTRTDLSLWQRLNLGRLDLSVGLTVLNLFDEDTPLRYVGYRSLENLPVTTDEYLEGFDYEGVVQTLEPFSVYNRPDTFQQPRMVRLAVKLEF